MICLKAPGPDAYSETLMTKDGIIVSAGFRPHSLTRYNSVELLQRYKNAAKVATLVQEISRAEDLCGQRRKAHVIPHIGGRSMIGTWLNKG